jgi:hypothetical protein
MLLRILNLGQRHTSAALPPGEESSVAIIQESGWAPEPIRELLRREKSLALSGNRTLPESIP